MNMGGGGGDGGHDMGMMMPPPSSPDNSSMHGHGGTMMTMHMTFFWGHRVDILFSGWPGADRRGVGMYLLALLFVFALSALVEFLSYLPRLLAGRGGGGGGGGGLVLTGIATLRTGLSYLVMLAVMSFNAGVLIAAVLGHALGYYVFGSGAVLGRGPRKEDAPAPEVETPQHKC